MQILSNKNDNFTIIIISSWHFIGILRLAWPRTGGGYLCQIL